MLGRAAAEGIFGPISLPTSEHLYRHSISRLHGLPTIAPDPSLVSEFLIFFSVFRTKILATEPSRNVELISTAIYFGVS